MNTLRPSRSKTYVLVPGGWHGGWWFRPLAHELTRLGHQAFPLTLTGLGERKHLITASTNLDTHVEDVVNVLETERLEDVILVGHSVSTMIAVVAAAQEPTRFSHLILLAPSPRHTNDPYDGYVGGFSREDIVGLLAALDSDYFAWAAALAPIVMGNPQEPELAEDLRASFCRTDPVIARHFAEVTFFSDTRPELMKLHTNCLILQCTDDRLAPLEVGAYLHKNLEHSTLVQLRATGHCPHISAPEETAQAILHYLDTHS
jgi:sigma-B regulation protein RsbQ